MSAGVEGFLLDTLLWTAALIALVLVLRRPVGRYFGPQAAYALWLIPILRLLLPPIELPAWLAPAETLSAARPEGLSVFVTSELASASHAAAASVAAETGSEIPWTTLLLSIWLGGAAVFLARRFQLYFRMREELLDDTVPVGEAGKVRLVETPAATSPVAFGVIDKVVALPEGFMASYDRTARDLALEHELAHHRGHDLLANFAAQPLFALHWFNPLAWAGWRAMRRDQEAACDARVVARKARADRATYAEIIAGFAAGPNIALAAPMACPVLGEKSIIHRLRSLKMSDVSPRRRFAGRALLVASILALPLTASITYAESQAAPKGPAPKAPAIAMAMQSASEAPKDDTRVVVIRREVDENAEGDGERKVTKKIERRTVTSEGRELTPEERADIMAELEEGLADMDRALEDAHHEMKRARIEMKNAQGELTRINVSCDDEGRGNTWTDNDGQEVIMLCTSDVMASALDGLKEARASIAKSKELDDQIRAEVLKALDPKIAEWNDRK